MAVLLSRTHGAWAWDRASTLKGDLRYTPTSVFMTFPWAGSFASAEQRERVGEASRRLLARRSEICLTEQIGLTTLYNQVDDGAWTDLNRRITEGELSYDPFCYLASTRGHLTGS